MIEIDATLPDAALLGLPGKTLADCIAALGGAWLQAEPDRFETDGEGHVTAWRALGDSHRATPAQPNTGNSRLEGGLLRFEDQTNCGFVLPRITGTAEAFTFSVLYAAPNRDARTLLCLNLGDANNYVFLYELEGTLTLKDQKNSGEVTMPALRDSHRLTRVTGALENNAFFLRINDGPVQQADAPDLPFAGEADLFIGCRSHRDGLHKTLGSWSAAEVMFFPGVNLLDPGQPDNRTLAQVFEDYRFWEA